MNANGTITFTTIGESVIGPQGPAGQDGSDYVLTNQDKSDIADIVLSELPTTQGYYMATKIINDTVLQDIAVAIQSKDGGKMHDTQMAGRINAIPTATLIQKPLLKTEHTTQVLTYNYGSHSVVADYNKRGRFQWKLIS